MVRVALTRGSDGVLVRVKASGHSLSAPRGQNVVCGAVSVLLRTAARALEEEPTIEVGGNAAAEGELELIVQSVPESKIEWARGVSDTLARGLEDLSDEYPSEISLDLIYQ